MRECPTNEIKQRVMPKRDFSFCLFFLLTSLFSLCFGCSDSLAKDSEIYPIGIYAPGNPTNYTLLKKAGISHILAGATKTNLDAAKACGLRVIATPGMSANAPLDIQKVYKTVHQFDKHPALFSWYLIDEPDYTKTDPEQVKTLNRYLKLKGIRKPTSLVVFKGYEAADYAEIPDIMMLDRYPIGLWDFENFNKHVRLARLATPKKTPLYTVIQAFDWSTHSNMVAGYDFTKMRPPTLDEIRNMTWSSLGLGANGIFYYCFESSNWKMKEHSEVWENLKTVIAEVRKHESLFKGEHIWYPKDIYYISPKSGFNKALEPAILTTRLKTKSSLENLPAGEYTLCINTLGESVSFKLAFPGLESGTILTKSPDSDYFCEEVSEGYLTKTLAPYEVKIYLNRVFLSRK